MVYRPFSVLVVLNMLSSLDIAGIASQILQANSSSLSAGERIPVSYFYTFNGLYNLSRLDGSTLLYRQSGTISFNLSPYDVTYAVQSDMEYINLYVVPDGNPFVMSISNGTNQSGFSITSGGAFTASCSFYGGTPPYTLGSRICIDASSFDADWRTSEDNFYLYSSANAVLGALRSPTCVTNDPNYIPQGSSFNGNTYVLSGIPAGTEMSYDELRQNLIDDLSQDFSVDPSELQEQIPDWYEMYDVEEPTEPTTDGNGNIIINNYDNATMNVDNTINGNADIDLWGNVNVDVGANAFGAGAFGAGAFADVDVNINAGAFGVGALGAGALGQVDVNGEVIINGNAITMNGGSITNNYYTIESGASIELPSYSAIDFTLDYDEILSERELESILNQETYYIPELETDFLSLELATVPPIEDLPAEITQLSAVVAQESTQFIDDLGLTSVYAPLAVFTIVCFILRGGK